MKVLATTLGMQLATCNGKTASRWPFNKLGTGVTGFQMSQPADKRVDTDPQTSVCGRGSAALLALRTKYGLTCVNLTAMDRITALQVAATLDFLNNNLPQMG